MLGKGLTVALTLLLGEFIVNGSNMRIVFHKSSYSMIVLYSRDHKGVGVVHEITSPKNQPQFSLIPIRQYWLGKTKPKQAFRSIRNTFNNLLRNFKNNSFNGTFYLLTD